MKPKLTKVTPKKNFVITTKQAAGMFKDKIHTTATDEEYDKAIEQGMSKMCINPDVAKIVREMCDSHEKDFRRLAED